MSAISVSTSTGATIGSSFQRVLGVSSASRGWNEVESALHLTRRGRLTMSAVSAFAIVLMGLVWVSSSLVAAVPAEAYSSTGIHAVRSDGSDGAVLMSRSSPALIEHVVVPGETVWSMAVSLAGDSDPRAYVVRIQDLNANLDGIGAGVLQAGDVVLLPNGG
jgi:hypothetical protein